MNSLPATWRRADLAQTRREPSRMGLWLPLTPVFWLLAPFVLLCAPLLWLAPPMWRLNPYAAVFGIGLTLVSLSGTDIDVDTPDTRIRLRIL